MAKQMEQQQTGGPGYNIPCYDLPISPPSYLLQHCRRSSSQPHAPSLALSGTRGTTAATVQRHSSSHPHALPLALSGIRGTTAATVQRRRSSQPHASSLALSGTRGTTAATVQRRRVNAGLAITLRRGKRSGMLVWKTEQSNNSPRRR